MVLCRSLKQYHVPGRVRQKRVVGPSDARLAVDRSRGSAVYVAGGFELVGYSARRSAYLTGSGLGEALGAIGGIKAQLDLFGGAH